MNKIRKNKYPFARGNYYNEGDRLNIGESMKNHASANFAPGQGLGTGMGIANSTLGLVNQGIENVQSPEVSSLFTPATSMTKSGLAAEASSFGGADAGSVSGGRFIRDNFMQGLSGSVKGFKAGSAFGP